MLAYVLALAVGLGSLTIYMAAFFFPEVHRKNDFIWSGVGLFYALVLWVCAGRITGGVLLGQFAGVALLGWSVSQTLSLRRQLTPRLSQQTELPSPSEVKNTVQDKVSNLSLFQRFSQLGKRFGGSATAAKDRLQQNLSGEPQRPSQNAAPSQPTQNNSRVQVIDKRTPIPEQPANTAAKEQLTTDTESAIESVPEMIRPNPPVPDELVQSARESAAAEEPRQVKEEPLGAELTVNTNQPAAPDMPGPSGKEVPIEMPQTAPSPPSEAGSTAENDVPEPIRPHAPDPELIEAAVRDAEEKHLEASPPDTETPENPSPS